MSERQSWIQQTRQVLTSPPPRRLPAADSRQASVLVPLFVQGGELWTLLTKRADDLPHHKSQYAFPGGGRETGESPWDAALREAQEEIGLEPKVVLPLGELDELAAAGSNHRVIPCVGAIPWPVETKPDAREIAEVFAVPLSAFANPKLIEDRPVTINGRERWLRIYHLGNRRIWGLTALVLKNLLVRLGLEGPVEEE